MLYVILNVFLHICIQFSCVSDVFRSVFHLLIGVCIVSSELMSWYSFDISFLWFLKFFIFSNNWGGFNGLLVTLILLWITDLICKYLKVLLLLSWYCSHSCVYVMNLLS